MATTSNTSVKRWQDQLILLLGLWFFITPWVFGYPIPSLQAWTAFISVSYTHLTLPTIYSV